MTATWTASKTCTICGGHPHLPQGHGIRCHGYLSSDARFAYCSREERAGRLQLQGKSNCYAHLLLGRCDCGETHGESGQVHGIGEARGARIVATYDYTDERGELVYQVVRKEPKTFRQRRPDGAGGWLWKLGDLRPLPYRLSELMAGVAAEDTIHIVEGEKDVEAIRKAMGIATCNSGGAGKWKREFARYFRGANIVIVRDRDEAGHNHARDVFKSLRDVVASIRVVEARKGKDAADHLGAGLSLDDFTPVWPLDDLRKSDPVTWKRAIVQRSLDPGDPYRELKLKAAMEMPRDPTWPTGLEGAVKLPNFRGVTILAGRPSSGKSYLAVASACSAARAGWDVLYLPSEMGDRAIADRFWTYNCGPPPNSVEVVAVDFGADVRSLIDLVARKVSNRNLLVVFDSVSSFIDQAAVAANENDVHGIGPLKHLLMWAINVRRNTGGEVSFLMLSELNAQGQTKGRFADHKADLTVSLETTDDQRSVKRISIVKGWEYETGEVGTFGLDVKNARFTRLE